ncbi:A/B/D/E cyclin [Aureobasidium pullulans]|nr:A/B/D/E cyclin [Aureobasidium pullulans]
MPPARAVRRAVTNENDENAATTRLTRAKAAALSQPDAIAGDPPKKAALGVKRATTTTTTAAATQPTRRRAALGDVSNVTKNETIDTKAAPAKGGKLRDAQKPTGITKPSTRTASTRSAASTKTDGAEPKAKRPMPLSGTSGNVPKAKRHMTTKIPKVEDEFVKDDVKIEATEEEEESTTPKEEEDLDEPLHKTLEQLAAEAKDLDSEDLDDPLMVAEYVHEIFDYMKELEITTLPNAEYMDSQGELEWKMRGILVDWLLEVHTRFRLLPETLFLAVNIIDRFLSTKVVQLDRLQLVGVTAMFIASKYEEVLSPHVQNFRHVADDGFTEQEILSAERFILAALDYDLSYPNPMNFLRRISKADNYDIQTRTLGKYLLEIGCLDHRFIKYPPSHVAAAAMYLARLVLDRGEWDATLATYAGYTEQEIEPVFKLMVDYLHGPVQHDAFFRKYASKKFLKASIVLRQWAKKFAPMYLHDCDRDGSETPQIYLTQAPNDHLCLFSHMVSAFLELRQFASQLAWRSRRSKRFSILDNAVILHQLHHVHTQQQDSPFTSSPVLLFSFFLPRTQPQTWALFLDTMALMLLHCKILFQQHVATVKTYNGPLRSSSLMRCWETVERYPWEARRDVREQGEEHLDEKEWSNCIGCSSTVVLVLFFHICTSAQVVTNLLN